VARSLRNVHITGETIANQSITVNMDLANMTDQAWPVPPPRRGAVPNRTRLNVLIEPWDDGNYRSDKAMLVGRVEFLPDKPIEAGEHPSFEVDATLRVKPGKYRLRVEYAWKGDDWNVLDTAMNEIVVK